MDQKILNRVRGLLAKAESTDFPDEADALTAKATQLMADYGIDAAMLAAAGQREDRIDTTSIRLFNPYSYEKSILAHQVGSALHCKVTFWSSGRTVSSVDIHGHASNRDRAEILFTSLLLQAIGQLRHQPGDVTYRRSWWIGYAHMVGQRIRDIEAAAAARYNAEYQPSGNGAEIVLADQRTQVDAWHEEKFGKLDKRKNHTTIDSRAYLHGTRAGARADLGMGNGVATQRASALPS